MRTHAPIPLRTALAAVAATTALAAATGLAPSATASSVAPADRDSLVAAAISAAKSHVTSTAFGAGQAFTATAVVEELLKAINSVPEDVRTVLRNNAGGHSNHSIFWTIMGPGGGGAPSGARMT